MSLNGAHLHAVLDDGRSYVRLSTEPEAQICIVFGHGFWGSVKTAWAEFPDLCDIPGVPGADLFKNADLYFFDYPAEKAFVKVGLQD